MSVAAHQILQAVGVIAGLPRIGGIGAQMYHAYPGEMTVDPSSGCDPDCQYAALIVTAVDLLAGLVAAP